MTLSTDTTRYNDLNSNITSPTHALEDELERKLRGIDMNRKVSAVSLGSSGSSRKDRGKLD